MYRLGQEIVAEVNNTCVLGNSGPKRQQKTRYPILTQRKEICVGASECHGEESTMGRGGYSEGQDRCINRTLPLHFCEPGAGPSSCTLPRIR